MHHKENELFDLVIKSGEGHSDLTTIFVHIHTKYEGTCTQYKYNSVQDKSLLSKY